MQDIDPLSGLREAVAEAVRVEMARRRTSQRALAETTGLSQSYIGRRLVAEMPFTTDDLALIATALDVPLSSLIPAASASAA